LEKQDTSQLEMLEEIHDKMDEYEQLVETYTLKTIRYKRERGRYKKYLQDFKVKNDILLKLLTPEQF